MANLEGAAGVGLTMLILFEVPNIFSNLLPYPCDLPSSPTGMIRKSEIQAFVLAAGIGLAGTLITNTPWPFFGALVVAAFLTWHYETANRMEEKDVY